MPLAEKSKVTSPPDWPLEVIPVLDIQHGQAVQAIGGNRSRYRPVDTVWSSGAEPLALALAWGRAGFQSLYLADLDAIAGQPPKVNLYQAVLQSGAGLLLDAGVKSISHLSDELVRLHHTNRLLTLVLGLESLASPQALIELVDVLGPERLMVSLDFKQQQSLANRNWAQLSPLEIVSLALGLQIKQFLLLDLADVGQAAGTSTLQLGRQIRQQFGSSLRLITGGGVQTADDLHRLQAAGFDAALVATALHRGVLMSPDDRAL